MASGAPLGASSTMVLPGMVGWRVKVKFAGQNEWFRGISTHFDAGQMYVLFDDGEKYTVCIEEGDKMKFKSQMTVRKLLALFEEGQLEAFQKGSFGAALATTFLANDIDPTLPLSAGLQACNAGKFEPDDADDENSDGDSTLNHSKMSRSTSGVSPKYGHSDDKDSSTESEDSGFSSTDEGDEGEDDDDDTDDTDDDDDTDSETSSESEDDSSSSDSSATSPRRSRNRRSVDVKWVNESTGVVRASSVKVSISFQEWKKKAEAYTGIPRSRVTTRYKDAEGDVVLIASLAELRYALKNFIKDRDRAKRREKQRRRQKQKLLRTHSTKHVEAQPDGPWDANGSRPTTAPVGAPRTNADAKRRLSEEKTSLQRAATRTAVPTAFSTSLGPLAQDSVVETADLIVEERSPTTKVSTSLRIIVSASEPQQESKKRSEDPTSTPLPRDGQKSATTPVAALSISTSSPAQGMQTRKPSQNAEPTTLSPASRVIGGVRIGETNHIQRAEHRSKDSPRGPMRRSSTNTTLDPSLESVGKGIVSGNSPRSRRRSGSDSSDVDKHRNSATSSIVSANSFNRLFQQNILPRKPSPRSRELAARLDQNNQKSNFVGSHHHVKPGILRSTSGRLHDISLDGSRGFDVMLNSGRRNSGALAAAIKSTLAQAQSSALDNSMESQREQVRRTLPRQQQKYLLKHAIKLKDGLVANVAAAVAAKAKSPKKTFDGSATPRAHNLEGFAAAGANMTKSPSRNLIPLQDRKTGDSIPANTVGKRRLTCIGSFQRGELLGSGSFGKVYSALDLATGGYVALKQVTISDSDRSQKEVEALEHEIKLLQDLSHPNIVHYYGTRRVRRKLYIILEFCSGGSVASALKQFGVFSEAVIRIYTEQVVRGLVYLHDKGIIHRDIKGSNLLLVRHPQRMEVKLADFGCSVQMVTEDESQHKTCAGTIQWMAPEVMKEQPYDHRADIWSLAMTVIEMATAKPPWSTAAHAMYQVCVTSQLPDFPPDLSSECVDFLTALLQWNPKQRPSAPQLLDFPFLRAVDPSRKELIRSMTSSRKPGGAKHTPKTQGPRSQAQGAKADLSALSEESKQETTLNSTSSTFGRPGTSDGFNATSDDDSIWGRRGNASLSTNPSGDFSALSTLDGDDSDNDMLNNDDEDESSMYMSPSLFMSSEDAGDAATSITEEPQPNGAVGARPSAKAVAAVLKTLTHETATKSEDTPEQESVAAGSLSAGSLASSEAVVRKVMDAAKEGQEPLYTAALEEAANAIPE